MKTKVLAGILLLSGILLTGSCSDDNDYTIHKNNIITAVVTGNAEVTALSATITGSVRDLCGQAASAYSVGVYYGTSQDPKTGSKATTTPDAEGNFSVTLTGLVKGETYYYCAFVTLQDKISYFGDVKSFTTTDALVGTAGASALHPFSATLGGTLNGVSDLIGSGSSDLAYGVVLSTGTDDVALSDGRRYAATGNTNSYTVVVDGLIPGADYSYKAYMNLRGTYYYGETKQFTTVSVESSFVDLGLSVEWATCNIGAGSPEETGGLYGWGDISGLKVGTELNQYGPENDITDTEYDICAVNGIGRMPSFLEIRELMANCTSEWTQVNGIGGYKFTASNGNSIFLPAAGSREEYTTKDMGIAGGYWSGSIDAATSTHAYTLGFSGTSVNWGAALRSTGLSIRAVKKPEILSLPCDNSKLVFGEIEEGKGNFRIELYNEYGASKQDPSIPIERLNFSNNCKIRFRLSGFDFKDGAPGKYRAAMQYAANGWYPSYWGDGNSKYDCEITGDGEYTVWCETGGAESQGAMVFCIDIMDQVIGDLKNVADAKAEIISIELDRPVDWLSNVPVDNSKLLFINKDNDGVNGRLELYNEYGDTKNNPGVNVASLLFNGRMSISFTVSGITDNLKSDASGSYLADISYADASWDPGYWGGGKGASPVTGNGTYNVYCQPGGLCEGAVVWCIELNGLWKDLVDPALVTFEVNSITTEN